HVDGADRRAGQANNQAPHDETDAADMSRAFTGLPPGLWSARAVLRGFALRELLESVWFENPSRPGSGCLGPDALQAVAPLTATVARGASPVRDPLALVLGLLLQAAGDEKADAVREQVRAHLPVYLDALNDQVRLAAAGTTDAGHVGLLFLLAQFSEDAAQVMQRADAALGAASPAAQAIAAIFGNAATRPERSRFILSYLGAEACASAFDARTSHFESILACPACHGRLGWHDDHVGCTNCGATYGWYGDIPDLVPAGCDDPEEFPEALVEIYETQTRPRFVHVMAGDWASVVTPAREEDYLARFLHPVDGPVLDLASGAGEWTGRVARLLGPARVIALDYSLPMLKACQRKVPGISLVRGSASSLPFADGSLGGMNCSDALQALPDPAAAFAEASRCLRPGAPFTVFTFREAKGPYAYFQHRFPASHRRLFHDRQIRDMADAAGMDVIDMGGPAQAMFFTARKRS
ncbi:MAG TPA: methyltransferase domain-containing protein, partial [Burkholderiaceae bacterium]